MQCYRVDVRISRTFRIEFSRLTKFRKRLIGLFQTCESEAERVTKASIPGIRRDGRTQRLFSVGIPAKLAIKIGEIDRCRVSK